MRKKKILTAVFIISLLPMMMNQYGGSRGVDEIRGFINLFNPIGIISAILFFIGVWMPFQKKNLNKILGLLGTTGIIAAELYEFLTWHVPTITETISLKKSMELTFPAFYIGLVVSSCLMIFAYLIIETKIAE